VARPSKAIDGNKFGSTYAVFHTSGYITAQGLPSVSILRNTFFSPMTIKWGGDWNAFHNGATMLGSFVNNRLVDDMVDPVTLLPPKWYDATNRIITID
jgi:hypothetical protein